MKKPLILLMFAGLPLFAAAQTSSPEVIASAGDYFSGAGLTNSYTVGELALVETYTTGTFMLTQGFQQPPDGAIGIPTFGTGTTPMTIFPNPGNGLFFLDYDLDQTAVVVVEVFDVLGQVVYTEQTNRSNGSQHQAVDISTQADGVYFVTCTIKTAEKTTKTSSKITLTR
jgi:hypothetical protein